MHLIPITRAEAFAFIKERHRHHKPPVGSIFQIAVADDDKIIGVAVVGHPVARMSMDGYTADITRLCTDGSKNACSMLYSACWRAARAMGYLKLVTFILNTEPGTSLEAAGWRLVGECGGGTWSRKDRPPIDTHPLQPKLKFEITSQWKK